jgi:hypothetical protein
MPCIVREVLGGRKQGHCRGFWLCAVGAYLGTVGAAIGAIALPGRLLHSVFFT